MSRTLARRGALLAAVAALVAAGCGAPATNTGAVGAAPAAAPAAPVVPRAAFPNDRCTAQGQDPRYTPLQSYEPNGSIDELRNAARAQLLDRNRLVLGTSGDVLLWGARNPQNGQLAGFDIAIAQEIATALLGNPNAITYKVITYGQRLPQLESGGVDLVAHTMTINCERWRTIEFSAEYYRAGQRLLVNTAEDAPTSLTQVRQDGLTVCVPAESTNEERLEQAYQGIKSVAVAAIGECLVKFQQGEVDAITGDDTVLAGFAAQDPYAQVVGPRETEEPYGIGVKKGKTALVRFVNAVIAELKESGRWAQIYADTMGTAVAGDAPAPPAAKYGR